jgi:hypothetical protein
MARHLQSNIRASVALAEVILPLLTHILLLHSHSIGAEEATEF